MSQIVKQAAILALLSRNVEGTKLSYDHFVGVRNENLQVQYETIGMHNDLKDEGPDMVLQNFKAAEILNAPNAF